MYMANSLYDVIVTFDHVLTSALIVFKQCLIASTASAHPSALSEPTSCVRTGYKEELLMWHSMTVRVG